MKVIGYCWAEVVEEGRESPDETIQQSIKLYAKRRRWPVRIQFEKPDHAFMEFAQRPWGRELLAMLHPGDILLVPDPSFLFRTPGHARAILQTLREKKVIVHSMDCAEDLASDKGAAVLMSVLQAMEAFETQVPAARMRLRKRQQRLEGRYLGGNPPFGFSADKDGSLRSDPKKLKSLNFMRRRKAQGASLRAIAAELGEKGIKISHSGVAAALKATERETNEGATDV
jgi:putative DNA-invertase from lambdoid prophage Rac